MLRPETAETSIRIRSGDHELRGILTVPPQPRGLIILAHPSASIALDPRIQFVASGLEGSGFATFVLDLLEIGELPIDAWDRHASCDVELLATRLAAATEWVNGQAALKGLPIGCFVTDTCAAAAVRVAVRHSDRIMAIVALSGRLDSVEHELAILQTALLLIQGEWDSAAISHQKALLERADNSVDCQIVVVPGTASAFVEGGTMLDAESLAIKWFLAHLQPQVIEAVEVSHQRQNHELLEPNQTVSSC